jgi:N-hydroxyarylamine O-acetyltransferase
MNVGRYFARIGYEGAAGADLATLRALHHRHIEAIPFENLDVLLGRRIDMSEEAVERKIVEGRRGGYCFEQNTLFRGVLNALGFRTEAFLGRIRRNVPENVRTPLTHMILRVTVDGSPWLADVGFGSLGTPAPIRLDVDDEQETPLEPRRIAQRGGTLFHQARIGGEWVDLYEFTLEDPAPMDFELGNWFSCTHPKANFVNNLVVTRVEGTSRLLINNREFVVRHLDGTAERRELGSPAELMDLLASRFGLSLPEGAVLRAPALVW